MGYEPRVFLGSAWGLLPSALPASTTAGPEAREDLLHGTNTEVYRLFSYASIRLNLVPITAEIPATSSLQHTLPLFEHSFSDTA